MVERTQLLLEWIIDDKQASLWLKIKGFVKLFMLWIVVMTYPFDKPFRNTEDVLYENKLEYPLVGSILYICFY